MFYSDLAFTAKLEKVVQKVQRILGEAKDPVLTLREAEHKYEDKYLLAEFLGAVAVGGWWNAAGQIGVTDSVREKAVGWGRDGEAVMLRFEMKTSCKYFGKETKEVEPAVELVTETAAKRGRKSTKKSTKTVLKVTEHSWGFEGTYSLSLYKGSDAGVKEAVPISVATCKTTLKTLKGKATPPHPESTTAKPVDVDISFLVRALGKDGEAARVEIDRSSDETHTPRRNKPTEELSDLFAGVYVWTNRVWDVFRTNLPSHPSKEATDPDSIFDPVAPVLRKDTGTPPLPSSLLAAQMDSFPTFHSAAAADNDNDDDDDLVVVADNGSSSSSSSSSEGGPATGTKTAALCTRREEHFLTMLNHMMELSLSYRNGVEYLEATLMRQLEQAVGRQLAPADFGEYMQHHYASFFNEQYRPRMFCHSVRREGCYPEGVISLDCNNSKGEEERPVEMFQRVFGRQETTARINSSTVVTMEAELEAHCWVSHAFESERGVRGVLKAAARQFSCYVVMLGKLGPGKEFLPSNALIVKDKDEVRIPLEVEAIPTPKAFEVAVSSLSPEQQEFAEAYRVMQLEGSLFGVAVIQIKPQLEELLKLPTASLTKEVELTQSILQLFIDYHIPPDLIMFSEESDTLGSNLKEHTAEKVEIVRKHVRRVFDMIQAAKEAELKEKKMRDAYVDDGSSSEKPRKRMFYEQYELSKSKMDRGIERKTSKKAKKDKKEKGPRLVHPSSSLDEMALLPCDEERRPLKGKEKGKGTEGMEVDKLDDMMGQMALEGEEDGRPPHLIDEVRSFPKRLNEMLKKYDKEAALHAGTILTGERWTKKMHKSLLAEQETVTLEKADETAKAYRLLDSLSKSGAVPLAHTYLHVVTPAVHFFDRSLMNTVVQKNVNPIRQAEHSSLLIASVLHSTQPTALVPSPALLPFPHLSNIEAKED